MTRALGSLRALFARRHPASKASSRLESALSAACWAALVYAFAMLATPARGGDLQEYVRLRGLEGDRLVGLGLVYGLAGTGDSMKDSTISSQPYAQLLKNLGNIAIDLRSAGKTRSIALVLVTVEIPRTGARTDDRLDVTIGTYGTAVIKIFKNLQPLAYYTVRLLPPNMRHKTHTTCVVFISGII